MHYCMYIHISVMCVHGLLVSIKVNILQIGYTVASVLSTCNGLLKLFYEKRVFVCLCVCVCVFVCVCVSAPQGIYVNGAFTDDFNAG